MGAMQFVHSVSAKTAKAAFRQAVEEAQYDYGHAGYTGTIAEKDDFVMISTPEGVSDPHAGIFYELCDHPDCEDKWGPAGCCELGPDSDIEGNKIFVFFGWASS